MSGTDLSADLFDEEAGANLAAELFGGKANNPDYQAGRQAPGALRGLASVANGPLMGFADEIGGALRRPAEAPEGRTVQRPRSAPHSPHRARPTRRPP